MYYKSKYEHTHPLFQKYQLIKLPDIILLQTCLFVYKSLYIFPVNTTFEFPSHNRNTRRPMDVKIPQCRTVQAQRSVGVRGAWSWNNLHQDIKSISSFNLFKTKIKSSIFNNHEH